MFRKVRKRNFLRFYAVAYAGFQSHWSCKSFSELQADKQKGIPCSHCRRHIWLMIGNFRPHSTFSKSSKAADGVIRSAWPSTPGHSGAVFLCFLGLKQEKERKK